MFLKIFILVSLLFIFSDKGVLCRSKKFSSVRRKHAAAELSDAELSKVAQMSNVQHFNKVLDNILVPRVVGSKQHDEVADYISQTMEDMGWSIERQKFNDVTPNFGQLQFENIIAKLNPYADRQLVLACHYDSKYMREGSFLGATDSAVPCAMMINLAYTMKTQLEQIKNSNDLTLTLVFFDGEEAFENWSPTDSIYGARNLASHWEKKPFKSQLAPDESVTELDRIDLMVLLDLLGAKNPTIYNYFSDTANWFNVLANAEDRLSEMGKLKKHTTQYFQPYHFSANIEDDHLPFLRRGVPVLHLIPTPFPSVWHKQSDNRSAVDLNTVENLNKILRAFVIQYLNLTI